MDTITYAIAHFFYPRHSNNHKAKLLHSSTLLILTLFLLVYQAILQYFPLLGIKVLGYASNIPPEKIIALTNQKRAEAGLEPLAYNDILAKAAKAKGEHMLANDYWAHVAPDGTEPWAFFINAGYKYRYAGENLARDFSNPESAIEAWLASPSHRDNMLSPKYKEIGVAVVEGDLAGVDTTIIVSLFGTQLSEGLSQVPIAQARPQATVSPTPSFQATITPTIGVSGVIEVSPSPTPTPTESLVTTTSFGKPGGLGFLISPFDTTRGISLATIVLLLAVMIIDGVVVSRKKITRFGGRTFAHLAFLGMVATLLLMAKAGQIL